jgi:uncharacterized DUF497 family protein
MFSWDPQKAIANFDKHGISFEESATIFTDSLGLDWEDLTHASQEKRYKRLGKSSQGNILLVVYTVRRTKDEKETIRIISARWASRKERKAYAKPAN